MSLSREQFLKYCDSPVKLVHVDGIPEGVYIKSPSMSVARKFSAAKDDGIEVALIAVRHCVCDAQGNPLLTDEDLEVLADKDPKVINDLCTAILSLSEGSEEPGKSSPKTQDSDEKSDSAGSSDAPSAS